MTRCRVAASPWRNFGKAKCHRTTYHWLTARPCCTCNSKILLRLTFVRDVASDSIVLSSRDRHFFFCNRVGTTGCTWLLDCETATRAGFRSRSRVGCYDKQPRSHLPILDTQGSRSKSGVGYIFEIEGGWRRKARSWTNGSLGYSFTRREESNIFEEGPVQGH